WRQKVYRRQLKYRRKKERSLRNGEGAFNRPATLLVGKPGLLGGFFNAPHHHPSYCYYTFPTPTNQCSALVYRFGGWFEGTFISTL
ncbi:unnamed protein product, partial [Linum tenue]